MDHPRIGRLTFSTPPETPRKAAGAPAPNAFALPREHRADLGAIPAQPPPDALREVDRAAARADELWKEERELHFEVDEDGGRVIVQIRDLEDRVIRTIPPSEALDVLSGRPL
jgi:FlaG protein